MAQKKQAKDAGFDLTELIDMSRETSLVAYRAAVQTQKAADQMLEKMIEAGTASQEAGLQFGRTYLRTVNQSRQDWMGQANQVTERLLTSSPTAFEYPFRNEMEQINDGLAQGARLLFDAFFAPLRAATRR
ncbi:MAG TPA: hypothetical protein VE262_23310 [Blastocatellia bacterium]|nr:hypothetical protein [Blastocatellia bacterium]